MEECRLSQIHEVATGRIAGVSLQCESADQSSA